ncbi:MAG: T9SS type A sorting domain-containing protein [Candidatus Electryonea clarkiae]|nr:T9SS type A sorting domain-containing protein [Candidatus Electryonea clarkiae]MDP8286714.1 T9SS type A sorting domain-containing protein [Candidatus Electryonea clarkiae]
MNLKLLFTLVFPVLLIFPSVLLPQDSLNVNIVNISLQMWDDVYDAAASGDYVYLATGLSGLRVIDISDPENPAEIACHTLNGNTGKVTLVGDYLYLTDNGLQVVDVSDPEDPDWVGEILEDEVIYSFDIEDNYLYTALGDSGYKIFNISDPTDPEEIVEESPIELPAVYRIDVSNGFLFLPGLDINYTESETILFDVSTPAEPTFLARIPQRRYVNNGTWDISAAVSGDYAYITGRWEDVGGSGFMRVFDISNPQEPQRIGNASSGYSQIQIYEDIAFTTGEYFSACDISTPSDPQTLGQVGNERFYTSMTFTINGDQLILPGYWDGLSIYDIEEPSSPRELSNMNHVGELTEMIKIQDNLYIKNQNFDYFYGIQYVHVLDISDPTQPEEIARWQIPVASTMEGATNNIICFLTANTASPILELYDFTDPEEPEEIGRYEFPVASPHHFTLEGNIACISWHGNNNSYVEIINISDPENPSQYDRIALNDRLTADKLLLNDEILYVFGYGQIRIYNLTNPSMPRLIDSIVPDDNSPIFHGAIANDILYLYQEIQIEDEYTPNLLIFDISDPDDPEELGNYELRNGDGRGERIYSVLNHVVYSTSWGFEVINVEDPSSPFEAGYYHTHTGISRMEFLDDYAYACENDYLGIYDLSEAYEATSIDEFSAADIPIEFEILSVYPNPFNSELSIEINLPISTSLKAEIFNILGQKVITIADGFYESNNYRFNFKAEELTSGIYFVQAKTIEHGTRFEKIVLLK